MSQRIGVPGGFDVSQRAGAMGLRRVSPWGLPVDVVQRPTKRRNEARTGPRHFAEPSLPIWWPTPPNKGGRPVGSYKRGTPGTPPQCSPAGGSDNQPRPLRERVRDGVTIEVPIDDEPRQRMLNADEEILAECELLRAVGKPVTLVTDDTGLSIRATARRITVVPMPETYLPRKPQAAR